MEVLLTEAMEAFDHESVVELCSNGLEDLDANVERIVGWVEMWRRDHCGEEEGEGEGKRGDD